MGRVLMYPRLAACMAEQGVGPADLAAAVGCETGTVDALRRGTIIPSDALKARFAEALNVSTEELFAIHPAIERLLAQAEAQGLPRGYVEPETLRRIARLANGERSQP